MVRMKKYHSYRGTVGKTVPNLLNRDFHTKQPNQKWAADVTKFSLFGRKLYLSLILDMYNSEIISYVVSEQANFEQITEMLNKAFMKLPDDTRLIFHWIRDSSIKMPIIKRGSSIKEFSKTCSERRIVWIMRS